MTELVQKGAKITTIDEEGNSPLHLAARQGLCDVAKELLRWGANPHTGNRQEMTTLEIAIRQALSDNESTKERLQDYDTFSVLMCKEMRPSR